MRTTTTSKQTKSSSWEKMPVVFIILSFIVGVQIVQAKGVGDVMIKVRFNEGREGQKTRRLNTLSTKSPNLSSSRSPTKITAQPSSAPSRSKQMLSKESLSPTSSPSHATIHPSHSPSIETTSKPSSSPSFFTLAPSSAPTNVLTPSPSAAPTVYDCTGKQDTAETFSLPNDESSKTCGWVAQSDKELTCAISTVRNFCPVTCGLCPGPPSSSPSTYPTTLPSSHPTFLPSSYPTVPPSSSPTDTNVSSYSSIMEVSLEDFSVAMDDDEKTIFQNTVKDFVTKTMNKIENVDIDIQSVQVVSQFLSVGATNGLLNSRDVDKTTDSKQRKWNKQRSLSSTSTGTGLLVEMLITGQVSYGTLPENFSFRDVIVPGFQNEFDVFLKDLEDAYSIYNSVKTPTNDDEGTGGTPRDGNNILIMYVSIGCGVGGMILAAILLVVHKRRKAARHQELHDQVVFADIKPSLQTIGLESPAAVDGESRWSWVDPAEQDIKKDMEDPYGLASSLYMSRSNSTYGGKSQNQMYSFHNSNTSSSELVTPTGSASTTSLGINLSPEALYEARKQQQNFCFYPPDTQQPSAISHSYPDQNGRLVYKSYVCYAPPGALGVIIDTTPEGPMVHAIKPTSQLLGTIAPGDIVVGLDNIETRHMTAPALTRLMARKAQQSERKITLLRPMTA